MKTINDFFGERVREARKAKGWSIEYLSFESGVNKNYISDLERGKRNPTLMILSRISKALNCDLSTLLQGIQDYSLEDIVSTISSMR